MASPMETTAQKPKKTSSGLVNRDAIIKKINRRNLIEEHKPSQLVMLQEIFEETTEKSRFVGDTMFWKYIQDIEIKRIYHTDSVEFMNLKVMFWETCFYAVLLCVFTTYVYQLQSRDVYSARQEQVDYWSACDGQGLCRIRDVENISTFWNFMQDELVPRAFTNYSETPPTVANVMTSFGANGFPLRYAPRHIGPRMNNVLLGTIRMRQLRVQRNLGCEVSRLYSHAYPMCYGPYVEGFRNEEAYWPRFAPTYLKDSFRYQSAAQTRQVSMLSYMGEYGGDGFMFDWPANQSDTATVLNDLWGWRWVDRATRGILIELSTLNPNVDVIVNTRVLFEFGSTGSVVGTVKSNAAKVFYFTPSMTAGIPLMVFFMQLVLLICFTLFFSYVLWLMYKTCRNFVGESPIKFLRKQSIWGWLSFFVRTPYHYCQYGWNLADVMIMGLFLMHMTMRLATYHAISTEDNLAPSVIGHPEKFMPFGKAMASLIYSNNTLSVLAMVMWIKLFKYLCISNYFRQLIRILQSCALKLFFFSVLLLFVFMGFAVAFFVGLGVTDDKFTTLPGSCLVLFFLLIDGYKVDPEWFQPGKDNIMPLTFFVFVGMLYFVLMNVFIAVVLDAYAIKTTQSVDPATKNPMAVFLYTYYNWMKGISLVRDDTEANLKSEDLSIPMELLPGVVRRKWVEKKRKLQRVANTSFAGMELFPGGLGDDPGEGSGVTISDWMLPSSKVDVFDSMQGDEQSKQLAVYEVPRAILRQEVSRAQLQRLMDDDPTLPILLQADNAVTVIRRFKNTGREDEEGTDEAAEETVAPVKALQGKVFGQIDALEKVPLDGDIPVVPEISDLTEDMSEAVTDVRNQFRVQLTGIIEATAVLFEHLVELTQGMDAVRQNHEQVVEEVRKNDVLSTIHSGSPFR